MEAPPQERPLSPGRAEREALQRDNENLSEEIVFLCHEVSRLSRLVSPSSPQPSLLSLPTGVEERMEGLQPILRRYRFSFDPSVKSPT
eukprot:CAMPEP_0169465234 /NCGR_PEP_ID=MMETSP1042-20121227/21100_1 /TAXON_ID=464988 /ORGANISM="Hemiselmis andersenii, Strain CCMP1180" /LENGTH=87 /DNA_ID=CAMNT_0009578155 /DNA_START=53 /DNA_END=312 /DNA_ORIENTATION=+